MKKRNPSPFITQMMEKFQQQTEQSSTSPSHSQVSQSVPKSPIQTHPKNLSHPPKVAPPPPPRIKDKTPTDPTIQKPETQESLSTRIKMAPQRPPRAKDREQNKTTAQESLSLQAKMAPPKPPRMRDKAPTDPTIPNPETQESLSLQAKMAPPKPPRTRDKTPGDPTIQKPETQESPSTHIKTAPQKPPRAKDREQNKLTAQEASSLQTKMAPPKPPRMKDRVQNSTKNQNPETITPSVRSKTPQHRQVSQQSSSSSQDSEPYAIPPSRKPHRIGDRHKRDADVQKTASPKTASKQPKPSQESKTSINTMEKELLLGAYHEEIRLLCEKTFGDQLILEQRIEAIKENPSMGEQLLWDITEKPQSISKLAGRKVLGIKNGARKQAEETLSPLCAAIEGFVYTAKYVQENISQNSHTKQQQHQQAQQKGEITQRARNPLDSEKKIHPLSNQEIARRVQQNPSVQYGQREIEYWCQIVYNDPFILRYRMEDMHKIPEMGEELVFQIEKDSTSFAPLAGRKKLGIKNGARKAAEESLPILCTAIKDYADTIKQVRESIVQNHQVQQQHHHQPLTDLDKQLQKQQNLSQSPKPLERLTATQHQEVAETSKQQEQPPIRPRRAETSKAMALS
ncbi:BID domain-containing T4SS effector [Bartonella queenslandensis]|uniref:BID domain-containing T4SS effector n=1 Tax=Bartonella queenslandensis TaxID=481138 RepID=UPI001BA5C7FB|nr:BID domain-containing T4SS effector [Bartonella queenslandensis]